MLLLVFIALFSSQSMAQSCGVPSPLWGSCKQNSDCVVLYDDCGPMGVYNEKSRDHAVNYLQCKGDRASCKPVKGKAKRPKGICKEGTCTLSGTPPAN